MNYIKSGRNYKINTLNFEVEEQSSKYNSHYVCNDANNNINMNVNTMNIED
jgi:hypothetical protein